MSDMVGLAWRDGSLCSSISKANRMADPKLRPVRCRGYRVRASFCVRCLERNLQLIRVDAPELIPVTVHLRLSPCLPLSQTAELNPGYFRTLDLEICR